MSNNVESSDAELASEESSHQKGNKDVNSSAENDEEVPHEKPRQWLLDRMFGKSPPPELTPPCWICYIPPCISVKPDFFEQNCFCERLGKIGVIEPNERKWRKHLMQVSLVTNIVAFCLSITACFAISTKFHILRSLPFSSGNVRIQNISSGNLRDLVQADIGLQAVAYSSIDLGIETVIKFDQFCDYNGTGLESFILPSDCASCQDASTSLIFTLAVSAFPYIPSMFTNVMRMYYNYDINCLKTFGVLANAFSMVLAMYSYLAYRHQCFFSFYEGDVYFSSNFTAVEKDSGNAVFKGTVDWKPGNALICIIVASALVGIDIICHLLVPSPTIARDHDEQEEYERQSLMNTSGRVTADVSWKDFITSFCRMICGKKQRDSDDNDDDDAHDT